jgi:hypothetical protein
MLPRDMNVFIVSHFHWDREWYRTMQAFRARLVDAIDQLLDLAAGDPELRIGRPDLWGLAAFGQAGVEAVLAILRRELETIMTEMGTPDVGSITPAHVRPAAS